MENTTTSSTPPTAAQRLAAADEMAKIDAKLNELPVWAPNREALATRKLEWAKVRYAPEPEPAPTGPTWQERRATRQAIEEMRAEADRYDQNSPVRAEIYRDVAAATASLHRGEDVAGAMRWADVSNARSVEGWTADDKRTIVLTAQAIGATPVEAMQFQAAWAEHIGGDASTLPELDFRTIWGSDFQKNQDAFERAVAAIPEGLWDRMVAAGLAKNQRLVNQLVAVGRRLER